MKPVKSINYTDTNRMIKELKANGQDTIVQYINALKHVIEAGNQFRHKAVAKISEQAKTIKALNKEIVQLCKTIETLDKEEEE